MSSVSTEIIDDNDINSDGNQQIYNQNSNCFHSFHSEDFTPMPDSHELQLLRYAVSTDLLNKELKAGHLLNTLINEDANMSDLFLLPGLSIQEIFNQLSTSLLRGSFINNPSPNLALNWISPSEGHSPLGPKKLFAVYFGDTFIANKPIFQQLADKVKIEMPYIEEVFILLWSIDPNIMNVASANNVLIKEPINIKVIGHVTGNMNEVIAMMSGIKKFDPVSLYIFARNQVYQMQYSGSLVLNYIYLLFNYCLGKQA
jgi:hypothetical protein